jgi:hypothetical protein
MDATVWWTAFGAIAQAAGALATFVAVGVALWQTSSERRLRASASAGIKILFGGYGQHGVYFLGFDVLNTGYRTIRVSSISWRAGWLPRGPRALRYHYAMQTFDGLGGRQPPFDLEPSERTTALVSVEAFIGAGDAPANDDMFGRSLPVLGAEPIRAIINVSGRKPLIVKPSADMLKLLRTNSHPFTTADDPD